MANTKARGDNMAEEKNYKLWLENKQEVEALASLKNLEEYCKERKRNGCRGCLVKLLFWKDHGGFCGLFNSCEPWGWDVQEHVDRMGGAVLPLPTDKPIVVNVSVV